MPVRVLACPFTSDFRHCLLQNLGRHIGEAAHSLSQVRRDWLTAARIARLAHLKLPPVRLAGRGAVFVHLEDTVT